MDSGRVPCTSQELLAMRCPLLTSTEIYANRMDSIDIDDEEVGMATLWTVTEHVTMANLDNETKLLQRNTFEEFSVPFLQKVSSHYTHVYHR